jgi:hypothetical protein
MNTRMIPAPNAVLILLFPSITVPGAEQEATRPGEIARNHPPQRQIWTLYSARVEGILPSPRLSGFILPWGSGIMPIDFQ